MHRTCLASPCACHAPGGQLSLAPVASRNDPADTATGVRVLQPTPVRATSFAERLRTEGGRRTLGISLALLIEALLLLALLSLGAVDEPTEKRERETAVSLTPEPSPKEEPEPSSAEREEPSEVPPEPERPVREEVPPAPLAEPRPEPPPPPPIILKPQVPPPPAPAPPQPAAPAPAPKRVYGPPDKRGPAMRDTERVGTAPNGEPLYAAAWYREPRDDQLRDYLSTATGPGWGLIACRTAPGYRVEDCVAIDEYPTGSQINRAILAAAWEFRVRPPRLGGRPLVGSWVRIRIDYVINRR